METGPAGKAKVSGVISLVTLGAVFTFLSVGPPPFISSASLGSILGGLEDGGAESVRTY